MKNIVLLITDSFRYDNLFERAKRFIRTPCLDAFSRERATELHGFWMSSFPTIPHRTDVTSGRLGWLRYPWQALDLSTANHLPKLLREQGYVSQLICDCPHLFKARFNEGFDAAVHIRGQEGDRHLLHMNDPIQTVMPPEKTRPTPKILGHNLADSHRWTNRYYESEQETFAYRTSSTTVRWLEENHAGEQPFFLWVDFFDPHEPWDPPEYLVRRYQEQYRGEPMIHPNYGSAAAYSEEELVNLWAHYAAEAELVDRGLGRVLQKLEDLGLYDDSIVVVTADHGFSIGDHGHCGKSNLSDETKPWPLYPEIGHVPFLIAGGGVPQGAERHFLAQPMDMLPSLCELAGVPLEAPEGIEGRSFAPLITGADGPLRDTAVTAAFMGTDEPALSAKASTPFVVSEGYGYVPAGAGGEELYDLQADPSAETDIAAEHPERLAAMRQAFIDYLTGFDGSEPIIAFWKQRLGL